MADGTIVNGNTYFGFEFNVNGFLAVGTGTLSIGGVTTNSAEGYIGYGSPSDGTVNVNSAGARWNVGTDLYVGYDMKGALNLANGGSVYVNGGLGTVYLARTIGYSGTLNIGAASGSAATAAGSLYAASISFGAGDGRLYFNHTGTNLVFGTTLVGAGTVEHAAGVTHLTSDASGFTGTVSVTGGTLLADSTLAVSTLNVASGGTLGGQGEVQGSVSVAAGGVLSQTQGTTLKMTSLTLQETSNVNVTLGLPDVADPVLFEVTGDLALDGQLNVTSSGTFDLGTYRLFSYGGTLTNNGLTIATLPAGFNPGDWSINVGGNIVALQVASGSGRQYWDGAGLVNGTVDGGAGTWNALSTNWTNSAGTIHAPWAGERAVFGGAAGGTVTVVGSQSFTGLEFVTAGYQLAAGAGAQLGIVSSGDATVSVTAASAEVGAPVSGTAGLVKLGTGSLTLGAANTYSGTTTVQAGTLALAGAGEIASSAGVDVKSGASFDVSGVSASATVIGALTGAGGVALGTKTLTLGDATSTSFTGAFSGTGSLIKQGAGTLSLSAAAATANLASISINQGGIATSGGSAIGDATQVTLSAGASLAVTGSETMGALSGAGGSITVTGGTLTTSSSLSTSYGGSIGGSGYLFKTGSGTLTVSGGLTHGAGAVAGTTVTTVQQGTLAVQGGSITHATGTVVVGSTSAQTGALTITGGTVSSRTGWIGNVSGSTGNVTVGTGGDWTTTSDFRVGSAGNGTLTVQGGGTVHSVTGYIGFNAGTSSATVTGSGSTWVNEGRLTLANSGSASGTLTITNGGRVVVDTEDIQAYGVVVGSNSAVNIGASGASAAAAAGELDVSRLQLRTNTSTLNFNHTSSALDFSTEVYIAAAGSINAYAGTTILSGELTGALAGTGRINVYGGVLELAANNSAFTGTVYMQGGTLRVSDSYALGYNMFGANIVQVTASGGTIEFASGLSLDNGIALSGSANLSVASGSTTIAGPISGTAGFVKTGAGTLVLSGTNSHTGGTTVQGGVLQGTTTSLQGAIQFSAADAVLAFSQAGNGTYAGSISGEGTVRWLSAGELTLSGASTYTGSTQIGTGTLVLSGAASAGASQVVFSNAGTSTLRLQGLTLSNALNGFGTDDRIDLQGLTFASGAIGTAFSGGTLTVTQGATTVNLSFLGLAPDAEFIASADGDGSTLLTVVWNNDAPLLDLDAVAAGTGTIGSYSEQAPPARIAPAATLTDPDSLDFMGGSLTVTFTANGTADDQLGVLHEGTGAGQIGVAGGTVSYGGVAIGSLSGGAAGAPLVVNFTSVAATPEAVQALIRAVTFSNGSNQPSLDARDIAFTVVDGDGVADGGADTAVATATLNILPANDPPTGAVNIVGSAAEDQVLSADTSTLGDPDGLGTLGYQWLRNGVAIGGANASTYTLTQADVGLPISLRVSYTDLQGASESIDSAPTGLVANVNDGPTGSVTITGTAREGQTLTAGHTLADEDGLGVVSYQWLRGGVEIAGATGTTYALQQGDVGLAISVRASYTDGFGTGESVLSALTLPVENVNDAPTGGIVISGEPNVGGQLTAVASLDDPDGMGAVSYRWLADGAGIIGATGLTYVVRPDDLGRVISLEAYYVDGQGTPEAVLSNALTIVQTATPPAPPVPPPPPPPPAPKPIELPTGGNGFDTAALAGRRDAFDLARLPDGRFTIQRDGQSETLVVLQSIERLRFDDKSVDLTVGEIAKGIASGALDALVELYIAYLDRVPESEGMAFWIGRYRAGLTLDQIGEAFYAAALRYPDLTGYREGMTNEDFVSLVYRNVLGRETPDADGLAFWSGELASGHASRGTLVAAILQSAHTFKGHAEWGWVADLLDNKVAVGKMFAIEQGMMFNTPEESIQRGMEIADAVTPTSIDAAVKLVGISDGLDLY